MIVGGQGVTLHVFLPYLSSSSAPEAHCDFRSNCGNKWRPRKGIITMIVEEMLDLNDTRTSAESEDAPTWKRRHCWWKGQVMQHLNVTIYTRTLCHRVSCAIYGKWMTSMNQVSETPALQCSQTLVSTAVSVPKTLDRQHWPVRQIIIPNRL